MILRLVSRPDTRLYRQGWICSMLFHAVMGPGVLALVSGLKPSIETDSFQWNVALVESPKTQPAATPLPEVTPQPKPSEPAVRPVQRQVIQHQEVHAVQPTPEEVTPQPKPSEPAVKPVQRQVIQHQEVHAVQPTPEIVPINQTASTIIPQTVRSQEVSETVAPMATQDTVVQEKQPTETTPTETTMVAAQETVAPAVTEPPGNRPAEKPAPQQAASEQVITSAAPPQAGPAVKGDSVKADYGWLMKALLGRINELKNYPHLARINHWEGKVVLRAVIKDDGQVLMVDVQEGSGRSVLDNDAVETLRKASPLKLDHPLGKPQVTILMPISYSLR